jgi:hypothetical protein
MELVGASGRARVDALHRLPGTANYFIGKDPTRWHTGIPTYAQVVEHNVYPGVDLSYQGAQGQLEYAFSLAPGTTPAAIRLRFAGVRGMATDAHGNLVLRTAIGSVVEGRPTVYQTIAGIRHVVSSRYILRGRQIGFAVGRYDMRHPLVIDPTILHATYYATFLGGSAGDFGYGVAVDGSGDAYMTGYTGSTNFPTTSGAYQTGLAVADDIVVSKLNANGTALLYSTYIGGSGGEGGYAIALDGSGDAFVTGQTISSDFPTTSGAFQTTMPGDAPAFVTELSADGTSLVYSTYLGGNYGDQGNGIAVDSSGYAYVTGWTESTSFPHTTGAFQTTNHGGHNGQDAFITKLTTDGSGLVYSTYLGGYDDDVGNGIAVDSSGDAFVTGSTVSTTFPYTRGAFQPSTPGTGEINAFVTELDPAGTSLVYSARLGGTGSATASGIAIDGSGDAFVTGTTYATDFPTTSGAYQTTSQVYTDSNGLLHPDAFVTEVSSDGSSLVYSTYLGGTGSDYGAGVALDSSGHAFVTGHTDYGGFPTTSDTLDSICFDDVYLSELSADGSNLLYSACVAGGTTNSGVAVDSSGIAHVTGSISSNGSTGFPTTAGAVQSVYGGGSYDAFVVKIGPGYQVQLDETGLPATVPHQATFDGSTVTLPYSTIVPVGSTHTYSYPSPVSDPTPGTRYVTTDPGGTITDTFSDTAAYTTQYYLTVQTNPAAAATGNASLTPSAWEPVGSTVAISADALVAAGTGSRYRFTGWSGAASGTSPSTSVTMSGPETATASYALQHLLSVSESGLPSGQTWHVTLNGTLYPGPLSLWLDHGTALAMTADPLLTTSTALYFFTGFTPAVPATLTAPLATTAVYQTLAVGSLSGSYAGQWGKVQTDIASGQSGKALSDIKAFVNHVTADSLVPPAQRKVLVLDAMSVYYQEICPALAAGQITTTTASSDYTYYRNTVISYGGTPLPKAC